MVGDLLGTINTSFSAPSGTYLLGAEIKQNVRTATKEGKDYIIKAVPFEKRAEHRRELDTLAYLAGTPVAPHIIAPTESFEQGRGLYTVFPKIATVDMELSTEKKKPLPIEEVYEHAQNAGSILHQIHEQHVVHGDVKPANILLPKIFIDFQISQAQWDTPIMARPGYWIGSMCFTAPELMAGYNDHRDVQSDVYSFGATVYYLLTGTRPHDDQAGTGRGIYYRILEYPPTPPEKIRKDTPERLSRVLMRSMERDVAVRHPTIEAFLDDLSSVRVPKGRRAVAATQQLFS